MALADLQSLVYRDSPPLMPWVRFAEWIGLGDNPMIVKGWLDRGYIPSVTIGKRLLVNVEALRQQLLLGEISDE